MNIRLYPNSKQWFKRIAILFIIIVASRTESVCQQIEIKANNTPLNEILITIRDTYNVKLSFDDNMLSAYHLTLSKQFDNTESTLKYLLKGLPLSYEIEDGVYLIYKKKEEKRTAKTYLLTGYITDINTNETLPYSHLNINGYNTITNHKGKFSYASLTDSTFHVKISYLGYYIKDTLIKYGKNLRIKLQPSTYELNEVTIKQHLIEYAVQAGSEPGTIRLNHKIANYLPGYGDNSVFNLLRLQSGILASGEQSNDLIIWGSNEGHSQVMYDESTLFGMKNFNDNISAINPYMAKDIRVLKGGYDAREGERVGGIVRITGIDGDYTKPKFNFNANNMTLNSMVSVPLFKTSALTVAMRQTYYKLYAAEDFVPRQTKQSITDYVVYPDYSFKDFNVKYSGKTKKGSYYFANFYRGIDDFFYSIDIERPKREVKKQNSEENIQTASSFFYGKAWNNGNTSNFTLSYSDLNNQRTDKLEDKTDKSTTFGKRTDKISTNQIQEINAKVDNQISLSGIHNLETGIGMIQNYFLFEENAFDTLSFREERKTERINAYVNDKIAINTFVDINIGIRADYPIDMNQLYIQPRTSATIRATKKLNFNLAWGTYNQFITKSPYIDNQGNYHYIWMVCNNKDIPVLHSQHFVAGTSLNIYNFLFSVEGFYKQTDNISRFFEGNKKQRDIYIGSNISKGLDFFLKKNMKQHTLWIAYSLSKSDETFPNYIISESQRALQDQRHEFKTAGILNFKSFSLSANYVWGSGFPAYFSVQQNEVAENTTYSRLDVSATYKLHKKRFKADLGLSVLNVLNKENIKYANLERISLPQNSPFNIHAEAVPFTPTLYINLSF